MPVFETASIKPANPSVAYVPLKSGPASLSGSNVTLRQCIEKAYGVNYLRITGPSWVSDEKYTIVARTLAAVPETQLMLMFQALLVDRFKFAFHREDRQIEVYALVGGKNLKLHPSADGLPNSSIGLRDGALVARHMSLQELATYLTTVRSLVHLDMQVVDMTGIDGSFDFTLSYTDTSAAEPGTPTEAKFDPPIFRNVENQLGL